MKLSPLILFLCLASISFSCKKLMRPDYAVGEKIDSLNGVYVYYNDKVSNVSGRNLAPDGYNIGLKYQCVEFVKRYYYQHYNHKMPDSYGHAKDFFVEGLADGAYVKKRNLFQYNNPASVPPKVGDLLIYGPTGSNGYGHVAIVSSVSSRKIEIIQQNPGKTAPSRETYRLYHQNGKWKIGHANLKGWLRK